MLGQVKIVLIYIAVTNSPKLEDYAARFVATIQLYPPGVEFQLIVCCNGGALATDKQMLFLTIPHEFYIRPNDPSWDIGGYQFVANQIDCDIVVCMGESVFFHRAGWLSRIIDSWHKYGPGFYGFFSSNLVRGHMNTTAFAVYPMALKLYPQVKDRRDRYEFEHGQTALWRRLSQQGKPTKFVTWSGEYDPKDWRRPDNILWKGDQSSLLVHCNHTERYAASSEETKRNWRAGADQPFK